MKTRFVFITAIVILVIAIIICFFYKSCTLGQIGSYIGGVSSLMFSAIAAYWACYEFYKKKQHNTMDAISKALSEIHTLHRCKEALTKNNGFDPNEKECFEVRIDIQSRLIYSYSNNIKVKCKEDFINAIKCYTDKKSTENYKKMGEAYSTFLNEFLGINGETHVKDAK